jgi:uncharacterized linocin/CFP29 family protein
MAEFLQRDQASLTSGQWTALDQAVVQTAQALVVGRRVISLVGPFGLGVEALPSDTLAGTTTGQIDLLGNAEGEVVGVEHRRYLPLPLIYKDFWIHGRSLETNRQFGLPLDISKAAAAAVACAQAEDHLVFNGDPALGLPGLRNVDGRQTAPLGDWGRVGQAFAAVVDGVRLLTAQSFPGPYALVVSPQLYAQLNRIFGNTGVLELEQVEKLARRGVYPSSVLPEPSALLLDSGAQNMDLAVAFDLSVAFV